tara:strand:- start:3087 stop:3923 length:837 start_codon:yes stop_codon:yes gene_type:complete
MGKNKVIIIDAYNMIHRCRFQWGGSLALGEFQIVYNFLRTFRSLVEQFTPDKIYFPLDGKPVARLELLPSYKGQRRTDTTDPDEIAYWQSFSKQKSIIINLMKQCFPVTTMYHSQYECDDLIKHIVDNSSDNCDITIISSDTDFIQLLNSNPNKVKLYNPISSSYRSNTDYDYVSWKAMVGDKSDNIPGVKGIGKKTAAKILSNEGELQKRLGDPIFSKQYKTSYELIKLMTINTNGLEVYSSEFDESALSKALIEMNFRSIIKEPYYTKFVDTFLNI